MSTATMTFTKPRLSFWQIWNMSFGFLGIQFGFALQNANTSRIFSTLGANPDDLAILWLAAPVTGLLVQPLIGYYSDRTWHPVWGRRRPYFAIGALLASISLCVMPNSSFLFMAAGTLWIMDASINISMEPFRAFVGDKLPPSQRTTGFAMQSFFIGIGAIVASYLPYIFNRFMGISNTAAVAGEVSDNVKYSFYAGAAMLFITVMWTVLSTKEYPPDPAFESALKSKQKKNIENEGLYQQKFMRTGLVLAALGTLLSLVIAMFALEKELFVLAIGLALFGVVHIMASYLIRQNRSYLGIVHIVKDFNTMPRTMIQLAYVQFFSWFALFAMWIYTTPAVTSHIFKTTDPRSAAYNDGADLVGKLFGDYNGIAALAAIALPFIARYTSRRVTHLIALSCGGVGLISFLFISDPGMLWLPMIGVGIAWASILSIPYAMLSGSLPSEKMGYYMGVFNFFIVIPQIVAATLLGFLLNKVFGGQSIYVLVAGGVSMIVAGLLSLMVNDRDEVNPGE
ncbi:MFS transporter [Fulvivirgaceae bacterium PWU4]|uniref:MFS transporter n=1 Tax=Chryseosolibacter histidini TaxID=2782349 RepID=A0AAP2DIN3_9BACT|nr:MFS transporter [Chryseosolibacter histidini]MBT1696885.1 MFS transporter [Chryseosolibacter histidini]